MTGIAVVTTRLSSVTMKTATDVMANVHSALGVIRGAAFTESVAVDSAVRFGSRGSWRHVEAEHHAALVVLGDVAVRHPAPRVRDLEQDVDRLARPPKHGVLPDQVVFDHAVAA